MDATRNVATTALGAARESLAAGREPGGEGLFRQVVLAAREAAGEVLEREARAAARQAAEVLTARGPAIAREQLEKRGGSDAAARAALEFGRAKLQGAGGTRALTSAAVGAIKESAGGLKTKVTDAIGGDEEEEGDGGTTRVPVEVAFDIGAPRQLVWDEWIQFENSPPSLHRIQGSDDGTLKVSHKMWGTTREEEVEIVEQVAEERLAWRASGAIPYRGVASFHSLDENLTRLLVTLEFEPQGLLQRLGAGARSIERSIAADVKRFKADLETRGDEDEGDYRLGEGDEEGAATEAEPEVEAEVVDEPDAGEADEELPDAEVYDETEDSDEPEEPEEAPEEEEEEAPAPPRRRRSAGASGGRRTGASSSAKSGGGKASSSGPAKSGSRKPASSSAKSGARTGRSGQSKSQSSGGGSRQRASSRSR
jgi:uncharacterized membrane protein